MTPLSLFFAIIGISMMMYALVRLTQDDTPTKQNEFTAQLPPERSARSILARTK
jgi:hypothetical protein